jgi:hypothetical protein
VYIPLKERFGLKENPKFIKFGKLRKKIELLF